MTKAKIMVGRHPDGNVAYSRGMKRVALGEGDTYEQALSDVKSAIQFHVESFSKEEPDADPPVLEAFFAEAGLAD